MTTITPIQKLGIISGSYAVKQILNGSFSGAFKGAAAGAVSAALLQTNLKLAAGAAAIGTAASGWRDLAHANFKTGLSKIVLGSTSGVAAETMIHGSELGAMTLAEVGLTSGAYAAAGLVQATVEGAWPYIKKGLECMGRAFSCCSNIAEKCFEKPRDDYYPRVSPIRYC